jgi:hypothetical protein
VHKDSKSSTMAHIGRMEHEQIASRYRMKNDRVYVNYRRALCQIRRFFCYIGQGDADYALRGLVKRTVFLNSRSHD